MTTDPRTAPVQLSLDVNVHPDARRLDGQGILLGTIKASIEVNVARDLQPGDELRVIVQNADGEVLNTAELEVDTVTFKPIRDKETVIGTERVHKANAV